MSVSDVYEEILLARATANLYLAGKTSFALAQLINAGKDESFTEKLKPYMCEADVNDVKEALVAFNN